jgi:hypothetical protein
MKAAVVCNDAFLVCHEIYRAARELVNSRVPTTQLTSASKFLWRPDVRPRLVEYVADFARAGERALGAGRTGSGGEVTATRRETSLAPQAPAAGRRCGARQPVSALPRSFGVVEPEKGLVIKPLFRSREVPRASRLILFRMYYLGGAEYEAARHLLGLSERTWSDWAEEVRQRVGAELIRARMYPPARYFRQAFEGRVGVDKRSAQRENERGAA